MGYNVYYQGEIEVSPPLSTSHIAIVKAVLNLNQTEAPNVFASIASANPKVDVPYCAGILTVSEDGTKMVPEENDSRRGLADWVELVRDHFLAARGYALNGSIDFEGEERQDRGIIFIKDSVIEVVDDVIYNPGPSWGKNHYASEALKQTVQDLLDSADESGFSSDFIMVATPPVKALRQLLPLS